MGVEPPYLYPPPSRNSAYNDFDPKPYTRASVVACQSVGSSPKAKGVSSEYNRHPDSYMILPYGQTNVKPMPPSTKRRVEVTRWIQLALRCLQMAAVLGLLVCAIFINHTQSTVSWVLRAAPAVDILLAAYALYHLMRKAKSRPPASSASYHFFAFAMDVALIPFYIFIAMADKSNLALSEGTTGRWGTLLKTSVARQDIMQATWLVAVAIAGIHVITLLISCYLVYIFRKIAHMPPDMNPLEDNLTSRRKNKHKYKNSEQVYEKHDSAVSFTDSPYDQSSKHNSIPFFDTREVSPIRYSPHNPNTAAMSRENLGYHPPGLYSQAASQRYSHVDLPSQRERPVSPVSQKQSEMDITDAQSLMSNAQSRLHSLTASSVYSDSSNPPLPRKSSKRAPNHFSSTDNWYAMDDDAENREPAFSIIEEEPSDTSSLTLHSPPSKSYLAALTKPSYQAVRQSSAFSFENGDGEVASFSNKASSPPPQDHLRPPTNGFTYQPLGMNPPTPPPPASVLSPPSPRPSDVPEPLQPFAHREVPRTPPRTESPRALKETSSNIAAMPSATKIESDAKPPRTESPMSNSNGGTPNKRKQYGSLRSAMQGVRGNASPTGNLKPKESPKPPVMPYMKEPGVHLGEWMGGNGASNEAADKPVVYTTEREVDHKGRVVSRSGADGGIDAAGWKKRNVSGKVAEEGRGGAWARRNFSGKRMGL
ncbi:MAG: hypothetical protein M1828_006949 [Chrysothrix sp. TS-e1954]|nr:MAG: hypothetical protein M1828_006949 [Chrysothrix sp. TS-e1954]